MLPRGLDVGLIAVGLACAAVYRLDVLLWSRREHRINRLLVHDEWASFTRTYRYGVSVGLAIAAVGLLSLLVDAWREGGVARLGSLIALLGTATAVFGLGRAARR